MQCFCHLSFLCDYFIAAAMEEVLIFFLSAISQINPERICHLPGEIHVMNLLASLNILKAVPPFGGKSKLPRIHEIPQKLLFFKYFFFYWTSVLLEITNFHLCSFPKIGTLLKTVHDVHVNKVHIASK